MRLYWSVTLYDFATPCPDPRRAACQPGVELAGIEGERRWFDDIYFSPKSPVDYEGNWVPTKAGERFEALFRFYGPEKTLFDTTWVLGDVQRVA